MWQWHWGAGSGGRWVIIGADFAVVAGGGCWLELVDGCYAAGVVSAQRKLEVVPLQQVHMLVEQSTACIKTLARHPSAHEFLRRNQTGRASVKSLSLPAC